MYEITQNKYVLYIFVKLFKYCMINKLIIMHLLLPITEQYV